MKSSLSILIVCIGSLMIAYCLSSAEAQLFDRILNPRSSDDSINNQNQPSAQPIGSLLRNLMSSLTGNQKNADLDNVGQTQPNDQAPNAVVRKMMNSLAVNVPVFYDMTKNGSSMGINVLQGLVRVDRGREAERSGLVGPRPLSVRVFGVPVYERGTRVSNPPDVPVVGNGAEIPAKPDEEEELPIET